MEDLDPRQQFQSLTLAQKARIARAAKALCHLMNEYDTNVNHSWKAFLYAAPEDCIETWARWQLVNDLERFLLAGMIQRCAVNTGGLSLLESEPHTFNNARPTGEDATELIAEEFDDAC